MRVQGLGSSLVFGAAASIALVFMQHVFAPLVGSWNVLAFYLAGCAVAYAALIGGAPRTSLRNASFAAIGAAAVLVLARGSHVGMGEVAIGLTCVVALVRSGLDPAVRRTRSVVVESVLGGASLVFAAWLATPGYLGSAVALWGYVLVQSLYFLIPRSRDARPGESEGDPFDRARERLLAMLEEV
jgi:hypothetical protein